MSGNMKRNVLVMQFERGINQLNKFGVAGKSIIEIRIPHWWLALKGLRLAKRLVRGTLPRDSGIGMDSENPATAVNAAANATNTNTNTIPISAPGAIASPTGGPELIVTGATGPLTLGAIASPTNSAGVVVTAENSPMENTGAKMKVPQQQQTTAAPTVADPAAVAKMAADAAATANATALAAAAMQTPQTAAGATSIPTTVAAPTTAGAAAMGVPGGATQTPTPIDPRYVQMLQMQMLNQWQHYQHLIQNHPPLHQGAAGAGGAPGATGAAPGAMPPPTPMNVTLTESKIGIKIPTFFGDGSDGDKTTAYKFREMIERAQSLNRWSDKDTAEVAILNMAGDAGDWADRLLRSTRPEERAIMELWSTMRPEFMKRFDIMPTPTQKVAKISNINQYQKESAKRYYDRLREALDYIGRETFMNPPVGGTWQEGFLAANDAVFQTFYLRGLDPNIRLQVQAQLGKGCTLEALVEKANEVDELIKEEKRTGSKALQMAPINAQEQQAQKDQNEGQAKINKELQQELGQLSAQLAAMHAGRSKQAGKSTGASGTGQPGKVAQVPMKDRGWLLCYKCRQYGQHLATECQLNSEAIARLTRQSKKDKPEGKAYDSQFGTRQE